MLPIKLFKDYKVNIETRDGARYCELLDFAREQIKNGVEDSEIEDELAKKIMSESTYNVERVAHSRASDIMRVAKRKGLVDKKELCFSKEELDYIHSLGDLDKECVLFILFCLSKYYSFGFFFKDSALFREAKVKKNSVDLSEFINTKKDKPFYMDVRKDTLLYKPTEQTVELFNPDNIVMRIIRYEDIVWHYKKYFDIGPYIVCELCSKIVKRTGGRQKYCTNCARTANTGAEYPFIRYSQCDRCGRPITLNTKSKKTLCEVCYSEDLHKRQRELKKKKYYQDKEKSKSEEPQ